MRIGTRGSALALAQARLIASQLEGAEIVVVRTTGDRLQEPDGGNGHRSTVGRLADRSAKRGPDDDKSRWVAELEHALLAGKIDLAVHSAKDVPGQLGEGLELLGAPPRAPAEDVLVGARSLEELPERGCVGTSSVRRAAQLLAARPDLEIVSLRGNVDTRLRRLAHEVTGSGRAVAAGQAPLHAIVLASAGLHRLGRERDIGCALDPARFVPAPGQGALALQTRADDPSAKRALAGILDGDASACLRAERAVAHALGAGCNTPLGAHAEPAGCGCLHMRAWVGLPDGSEWLADELVGGFYDPRELGVRMAERMRSAGAGDLLRRAEEMAVEGG
jgi:hydroxymethylbilane synthase